MIEGSNREHNIMKDLGDKITSTMPGYGFALLVFNLNEPGLANYISNAQRASMSEALRECANRLEAKENYEHKPFKE